MKEISSEVWPGGQWTKATSEILSFLRPQDLGWDLPVEPLTQEIHESTLWLWQSQPFASPQIPQVKVFSGHECTSGDLLTGINYFNWWQDEKSGREKTFSAAPIHAKVQCQTEETIFLSQSHSSNRTCERGNEVTLKRHPLSSTSAKSFWHSGSAKRPQMCLCLTYCSVSTWLMGSWRCHKMFLSP